MSYKILNMRSTTAAAVATELMFETASARADGVSLLRFNLSKKKEGISSAKAKQLRNAVERNLKLMKKRKAIQFFAFPNNFAEQGMESRFLINKYPELFEVVPEETDEECFVYVKL